MTTICKEHEQRLPQLNGPYGTETQLSDPQPHKQKLASFASLSAISGTFNSLSKVLFIFPSRYLFAIGLGPIFSFRRQLPPILHTMSKVHDSMNSFRTHPYPPCGRGSHPPWRFVPKRLTRGMTLERIRKTTIQRQAADLHLELFPVQSPLLRESYSFSFPPLTYMLKFSG